MDYNEVTLVTAFIAGTISFLSPCVLPLLPTYMAFLTGAESGKLQDDNLVNTWPFLLRISCFLSGLSLVFIMMGATASYFGQLFLDYQDAIRQIGAIFMVIMGIHLLGIVKLEWLEREYRPLLQHTFQGPIGAFILGVAFTAGWTPCTGPILASILVYASTTITLSQGAFLLFVYSLGFSVPFLLMALFFKNYFFRIKVVMKWLPYLQGLSGVMLIIIGIMLYFNLIQRVLGIFLGFEGFQS
ncbi:MULTISPECIES: cytochrome c biogenesis CcdA family protein [Pelosinus]|uniref:Cytochrome c biogenesis protein transmembrane region n=1 Tax=Pelosinus fermentans B4 TaxID=1149862 RepID=I8RD33_9FIRM|nr:MULTISPECIES: cytochrome c biogenesis protein CcdA [Pelosinus]EIW17108.1 cytochrome c biogenesis protein transmembrane region [Pelosinus fermentans B4]EIW23093.1 cytochrome c biogenesis protein transmembrane region [Pelosinus fermentans A11]OAM93865.1 cytochrome c biogenesis protein transmembrane region [Pelosinus fermentans DSM 17108]SDQ92771.1 cytochrome c-type biogenesis protein [Pelosinus fermentans]